MSSETTMMLDGTIVLITGAGSGLGAAMARGVAAAGANVALVDVDAAALSRTQVQIRAQGPVDSLAISADITSASDVERICDAVTERFGALDVLVNNAGLGQGAVRRDFVSKPVRLWEVPIDVWRRILDVNVTGSFLMMRAFLPQMLSRGRGRIVNVTTNLDAMLRPGFAPYGGSKAAIEATSATLASELAGTGVSISILIPGGPADTEMIPRDAHVDRSQLVSPDAMVAPLVWLCSNHSDNCGGSRIVAGRWRAGVNWRENLAAASAPIGWPSLAGTDRIVPMAGA